MPRNAINLIKVYRKFGIQGCDYHFKICYWLKILALFQFLGIIILCGEPFKSRKNPDCSPTILTFTWSHKSMYVGTTYFVFGIHKTNLFSFWIMKFQSTETDNLCVCGDFLESKVHFTSGRMQLQHEEKWAKRSFLFFKLSLQQLYSFKFRFPCMSTAFISFSSTGRQFVCSKLWIVIIDINVLSFCIYCLVIDLKKGNQEFPDHHTADGGNFLDCNLGIYNAMHGV